MKIRSRVAVLGATGYAGAELLRLLRAHPAVSELRALARGSIGVPLSELFPNFCAETGLEIEALGEPGELARTLGGACDVAFLGLPHAASAKVAAPLLEAGVQVIDLSADFRLRDRATYETWYGAHPEPALIEKAVYGLPERYREAIREAELIACPGCYPTATLLAVLPLLEAGLVDGGIIADCKSGISGSGRNPRRPSLFAEAGEQISVYGVGAHRHEPEIAQEASRAAGREVEVTFTPHLAPMSRGILATVYLRTVPGAPEALADEAGLRALYRARYADEPFVEVLPEGRFPATGGVRGSNRCTLGITRHPRTAQVIAVAAIDNLVKGAAGQAIQCFNLRLGLDERTGLSLEGSFP